ncbi:hypothetical protein F1974_10110 [Akkermansia sp. BIOML-A11]|nr:hypothetical protein F1974_10110 [Akkermansia sp. BIOML-A11]
MKKTLFLAALITLSSIARSQYKKPEFSFSHVHFQGIIYSLPRKEDQSITAASQVAADVI